MEINKKKSWNKAQGEKNTKKLVSVAGWLAYF